MKTFIASIIVLIMMLFGFCIYQDYLTRTIRDMTKNIDEICIAAEKDEWSICRTKIQSLKSFMAEKEKMLHIFADHAELDEAEQMLVQLEHDVLFEFAEKTILDGRQLEKLLNRLAENEYFSIKNILRQTLPSDFCHIIL